MEMRFSYNFTKALQAVCYLLERLGTTDKVKLMKLLYLADREHFLKVGIPITGDRQVAMPHGPVPSSTLSALNGEVWGVGNDVFKYVHLNDHSIELRLSPGDDQLAAGEKDTLDEIIGRHGKKATWVLVKETHKLPEYKECYVEGTSRPIPYERIAKYGGNESRFRLDRPVLSLETVAQLECPFPPDADL